MQRTKEKAFYTAVKGYKNLARAVAKNMANTDGAGSAAYQYDIPAAADQSYTE
jgi:hypothetical protein